MQGYVVYVAAIPLICTLLGSLIFGLGINGITYRPSVSGALTTAVLQYALQLGGVYVFALIIDALTPSFGGRKDRVSGFKLAAYSATASWLAGVFMLVPGLSVLTLLGLYSLYLLYTGVPVLMNVPAERTFTFTAAIIAVGIVISIVAAFLGAALLPNHVTAPVAQQSGKLMLPGGGRLDMSRLEQAQKRLEYITKNLEQTRRGADGSDADSNAAESSDAAKSSDAEGQASQTPAPKPQICCSAQAVDPGGRPHPGAGKKIAAALVEPVLHVVIYEFRDNEGIADGRLVRAREQLWGPGPSRPGRRLASVY